MTFLWHAFLFETIFERAYLSLTAARLTDARMDGLDAEAMEHAKSMKVAGSRRATALRPATRLVGPLPNIPMEEAMYGNHHPLGVGRRWLN